MLFALGDPLACPVPAHNLADPGVTSDFAVLRHAVLQADPAIRD